MIIQNLNTTAREDWQRLWRGYLEFYKTDLSSTISDITWQRLIDPLEPIHGFGAFHEGRLVGFAHILVHRSTWAQNGYAYLEDLFVDPEERGKGIGEHLIRYVYDFADKQALERVYWATQTDNPARALYDRMAEVSDFVQYRRLPA